MSKIGFLVLVLVLTSGMNLANTQPALAPPKAVDNQKIPEYLAVLAGEGKAKKTNYHYKLFFKLDCQKKQGILIPQIMLFMEGVNHLEPRTIALELIDNEQMTVIKGLGTKYLREHGLSALDDEVSTTIVMIKFPQDSTADEIEIPLTLNRDECKNIVEMALKEKAAISFANVLPIPPLEFNIEVINPKEGDKDLIIEQDSRPMVS